MAELNSTAPNLNLPKQVLNPAANSSMMANPNLSQKLPENNPAANSPDAALANLLNQVPQATANSPAENNPELEKKPETNLNEQSGIQKFSRDLVSIGQLFAAAPLVLSSFINQAENISKYGKEHVKGQNIVSYTAYVIDSLSYLPRWLLGSKKKNGDGEDDVSHNGRPSLSQDSFRRLLHPNLSKEFTSLLFTFRRVIFNMFPNTFIVPSEEHDEDDSKKQSASSFSKTVFETSAKVLSPFRWISSMMSAITIIPANLFGVIFAYTGNQKLYDISKDFSKVTDLFTPIVSNLSSLYSSAKAFIDSYTSTVANKKSLSLFFGKYNISYLHVLQGSIGSLLSLPYFFGVFSKAKEILREKDENDKFKFVTHSQDLVGECAAQIKSIGLFKHDSVSVMQDKVGNFVNKFLDGIQSYPKQLLEAFFNSSPIIKNIFSKVRPMDHDGRILAESGPNAIEPENFKDNYFLGINKKIFFKELFDLLHPIQSLLMLLPNTFVPLNDPYVADNAKRSLRIFDRLMGINSMVLSVPNYFIYALSTRVPQLILKGIQMKYRIVESRAETRGTYNPDLQFKKTIEFIRKLPLFGFNTYLAEILDKTIAVDEFTFRDEKTMSNLMSKIETTARAQEPSVKASELVGAIRIGMRTILGKGWFYAKRTDGLTDEERSSQSIYNSLGTFQEGIYKFPVIGWITAPFIGMIRKWYYVAPKTGRKILQLDNSMPTRIAKPVTPAPALAATTA